MFFHNFKYTLKILLKNKVLIFWTFAFPIILGTMFYMAFSGIADSEKLSIINLGIVDNESFQKEEYLKSTFESLSNKDSDNYLFDITYGSEEDIKELLETKDIDGYINNNSLIVKENGINQTIIKYVLDEVIEYETLIKNLISSNNFNDEILSKLMINKEYIKDISNKNMDYMMIEFYTLIAMSCLFSSLLSCESVKNYLANINKKGARITVSKASRFKLIAGSFLSSFLIQMVSVSILLIYTKYGLHVDYGNNIYLVILLTVLGSLAGLSLGVLVGSIAFKNDATRIGINNIIVMLGCFLSGMMGVVMKYVVDTNVPLLNKINPANMITDGFYALYYYDNLNRFYFNIISLTIFIIILLSISVIILRRKKYDSI